MTSKTLKYENTKFELTTRISTAQDGGKLIEIENSINPKTSHKLLERIFEQEGHFLTLAGDKIIFHYDDDEKENQTSYDMEPKEFIKRLDDLETRLETVDKLQKRWLQTKVAELKQIGMEEA